MMGHMSDIYKEVNDQYRTHAVQIYGVAVCIIVYEACAPSPC